jgi:putative transposase
LYQLLWCPKRRKPVLTGAIATRLTSILHDVAAEHGWSIEPLAMLPDHVHLVIRATPTVPAHAIARRCKGRSSRFLRQEFPTLRRRPSRWTRSYCCSTAGNLSAEAIQRYSDAQKGT